MFVANRSVAFRITVLEVYHLQRVMLSALIHYISNIKNVFIEL